MNRKGQGRKPKPTNLHVLHGNPGKRKLNASEPKPDKGNVRCPDHLSKTAKKEWLRIRPELERLGLLTIIDVAALAAYCQAYGRWVQAEKDITEKGVYYKAATGTITTSPALWVANKALDQMHKFLSEFGMTPSCRSRITVAPPEVEDPMDAFLRKNNG